ncbi:MAG: family 10 glycosylhydrolase [Candidatus Marinimicrobia bacterium]|nr:family 10 glycosylhydrolase [Candidatus Neomarinimicrobiota bacterium]
MCRTEEPELTELRGVWITNVDSEILDSYENIKEGVEFLAEHHFNIIYPVVWNDAKTLYPSKVMEETFGWKIDPRFEGRDPLAEIIQEAHKHNIAVVPWFEYGFSSSYKKDGGKILAAKPEWKAKDVKGNLLTKNHFEWMNGYHPEVQQLLVDLIMEVVNNYDVDGVQGDDRLPAQPSSGGYSDYTKKLYASEHGGLEPPLDFKDDTWLQWRADQLTKFAGRVYKEVKAVKPEVWVTWSPSVYPWSKEEYLQDWPAWYKAGAADFFHPQVYRHDFDAYQKTLNEINPEVLGFQHPEKVIFPGVLMKVGDYYIESDHLKKVLDYNREQGFKGEVFFFYEGLRHNHDELAKVLVDSYYKQPAKLPFKPQFFKK